MGALQRQALLLKINQEIVVLNQEAIEAQDLSKKIERLSCFKDKLSAYHRYNDRSVFQQTEPRIKFIDAFIACAKNSFHEVIEKNKASSEEGRTHIFRNVKKVKKASKSKITPEQEEQYFNDALTENAVLLAQSQENALLEKIKKFKNALNVKNMKHKLEKLRDELKNEFNKNLLAGCLENVALMQKNLEAITETLERKIDFSEIYFNFITKVMLNTNLDCGLIEVANYLHENSHFYQNVFVSRCFFYTEYSEGLKCEFGLLALAYAKDNKRIFEIFLQHGFPRTVPQVIYKDKDIPGLPCLDQEFNINEFIGMQQAFFVKKNQPGHLFDQLFFMPIISRLYFTDHSNIEIYFSCLFQNEKRDKDSKIEKIVKNIISITLVYIKKINAYKTWGLDNVMTRLLIASLEKESLSITNDLFCLLDRKAPAVQNDLKKKAFNFSLAICFVFTLTCLKESHIRSYLALALLIFLAMNNKDKLLSVSLFFKPAEKKQDSLKLGAELKLN